MTEALATPRRTPPTHPAPRRAAAAAAHVPWSATASRWLRRVHLYSGLAMLPFVLVYGVSAFLFNHGGGAAAPLVALPVTPLAVDAVAQARAVAAALAQDPAALQNARLDGDWTFEFTHDGRRQRLVLPSDGGEPHVRTIPPSTPRSERLPAALFAAGNNAATTVARAVLAAAGMPPDALRRTGAPTLRYSIGDRETSVSLERGQPSERAAGFDLGRLLQRLHTAHGYGGDAPRIFWAVVVDLMAGSMVLWAVSGLVMWWQRRSHRVRGLLVLVATFAFAVTLAVLMHSLFSR
jgi:hypothetical protein